MQAHPVGGSLTASRAPSRRLGRAGVVVLSILAVVAAVVATQPLWLAPLLGHWLTASAGRSVAFESAFIGVSPALEPVVHFRGVRIENSAWAEEKRPFARLAEAIAIFSWRSVAEVRPVIGLMVLRDGEVDLERQADGLRNWRLRDPDNRGPGRYKVLALEAEAATVRFRHGGVDVAIEATASPNTEASATPTLPTRIDLKGSWRALPFTASVATAPVLTFLETNTTFALRGWLVAGGARFEADGAAGDIFREPTFDAAVTLVGDSLAPFRAFIGARHDGQPKKAFRVEGRLQASNRGYALTAAKARIGASDLAGDLTFARSDPRDPSAPKPPRNTLHAKLSSDLADLADLRWLGGHEPAPMPAAAAASAAPPGRGHLFLSDSDGDIAFDARRVRAAAAPWLQSLSLAALLANGRVEVSRFAVGLAPAGRLEGHAKLDLGTSPPAFDGEATLGGLRVESLMKDKARLTGTVQATARLNASGDDAKALLASLHGHIEASLGGGTISSLLDAEMGLQGGKIVRSLLGGASPIPIRCAAVSLDLSQGRGVFRTLVLDTERTRTLGTGSVDLGGETLDVVLTPEAKSGGLFVLDRSIRLNGPVRQPARALVDRATVPASAGRGCAPEAAR